MRAISNKDIYLLAIAHSLTKSNTMRDAVIKITKGLPVFARISSNTTALVLSRFWLVKGELIKSKWRYIIKRRVR